ncbi:MAG: hypothetical protein A3G08_04750 [Candidatus Magasanikbacteria bacterium RIFCSPLOWO2_12_FULL_47_9b]|nr:MAG: hypothetical protein A3G08_04750 [Candidatus Magasanikbacteria bacterium RIFCSPLOWO2_12_FULL_47_9b]
MEKGKERGKFFAKKEKPEFDQNIVDLARVTRVTAGGKQLSFRACVLIGDRKGRVGYGVEKGKDVQIAVEKAVNQAKKNLFSIPIVRDTIPHRVEAKFKAAKIMIKPAPRGSGIIAGSSVRTILDLAGVANAVSKILGKTNNKSPISKRHLKRCHCSNQKPFGRFAAVRARLGLPYLPLRQSKMSHRRTRTNNPKKQPRNQF